MKKIISVILSILIMTSASLLPVSSFASSETISDEYIHAADILKAICPDIPLGSDGSYTRGEFVAAVVTLLNISPSVSKASFMDVPKDHIYAPHIASGVKLGLINSQNMFYPDAPITYSQAVKILTSAIGYGERAELTGGYPSGYIKAANEAKIGIYVSRSGDDIISYADGASLLCDMATADILEITSYGDTYKYSTTRGKNILSVYHNIKIAEGVINANQYTTLKSADTRVGKGRISVNGKEFDGGEFYKYIGHNVRLFYKDNPGRTVIYAYPLDNNIINCTTEDTLRISGTNLNVTYADGELKNYTLVDNYSVIYNGKYFVAADFNTVINPSAGRVWVIDNDNDRKYDVICIESIEYGFVGKVNQLEYKIYDKYKKNGLVDLSDPNCSVFISDADGNALTIDDIEPNTVVGYITSQDRLLMEVRIYDNAYGGVVNEKISDNKLKVRDNIYELSDYYISNIKPSHIAKPLDSVKLGSEIICYLGEGDDIVYIEYVSRNMVYGYLVDIGSFGGIDAKVSVKICDASNGIITLDLANKVNTNGFVKNTADCASILRDIISGDDRFRTVKYSVNSDKEIGKIFNAIDATDDVSVIFDEYKDESAPKVYLNKKTCYYLNNILCPSVRVTTSTSMIQIVECTSINPSEKAEFMKNDENYAFGPAVKLANEKNNIVTVYDVDKSGLASFVIRHDSSNSGVSVDRDTSSYVVEKLCTTIDNNGSVSDCIKAYSGGKYENFFITADCSDAIKNEYAKLAPGDIVRLLYDKDNIVTALVLDYDCSEKTVIDFDGAGSGKEEGAQGNFVSTYVAYFNGYVYSLSSNYATIVDKTADMTGKVSPDKTALINLSRGTTVFVKFNRDRSGSIIDAQVYTEPSYDLVETWYASGANADYIVSRQRFYSPSLNVIYTN